MEYHSKVVLVSLRAELTVCPLGDWVSFLTVKKNCPPISLPVDSAHRTRINTENLQEDLSEISSSHLFIKVSYPKKLV